MGVEKQKILEDGDQETVVRQMYLGLWIDKGLWIDEEPWIGEERVPRLQ